MSEINPKTVRDFARRAILSNAEDVDYCSIGEQFGDDEKWPQGDSLVYEAMLDAVHAATTEAIVTVSWPDEQSQAERDGDVRAVREACADYGNDEGPRGIRQLYARFEERIAELDAREAGAAAGRDSDGYPTWGDQ